MKKNKAGQRELHVVEVTVELIFDQFPCIEDVFDEIKSIESNKDTKGITGFSWYVDSVPKVSYYKFSGKGNGVRDTGNKSSTKDD